MEIDNTASHSEIMITSEGPKMIEIGARLGGDFISSHLTRYSTGINMDKAAIQISFGRKPYLKHQFNRYSFIKYLELPTGKKVIKISDLSNLKNRPGLVHYEVFIKEGELMQPIIHSGLRPACLITEASTKSDVIKLMQKYETELKRKILLT